MKGKLFASCWGVFMIAVGFLRRNSASIHRELADMRLLNCWFCHLLQLLKFHDNRDFDHNHPCF